jgi:hypothetical protein
MRFVLRFGSSIWFCGLSRGEKVLYVEQGELWRSTVEMLSRREVQAIVIVPAGQLAVPDTGED